MTAKKIFKIIGIFIIISITLFFLFVGFIWASLKWNRYSKNKEAIRHQKEVCDTIKTVQGNFEIKINGFKQNEIKQIKFRLVRDKSIIKDTVINFVPETKSETQTVIMPFNQLNIKDEIVVTIKDLTYVLSGYSYKAGFNYGMFGPVGPCICGIDGYQKVNGKHSGSGWLLKKDGLLNYNLGKPLI